MALQTQPGSAVPRRGGHWNSVVLISARDALWRLPEAAMTHCHECFTSVVLETGGS